MLSATKMSSVVYVCTCDGENKFRTKIPCRWRYEILNSVRLSKVLISAENKLFFEKKKLILIKLKYWRKMEEVFRLSESSSYRRWLNTRILVHIMKIEEILCLVWMNGIGFASLLSSYSLKIFSSLWFFAYCCNIPAPLLSHSILWLFHSNISNILLIVAIPPTPKHPPVIVIGRKWHTQLNLYRIDIEVSYMQWETSKMVSIFKYFPSIISMERLWMRILKFYSLTDSLFFTLHHLSSSCL